VAFTFGFHVELNVLVNAVYTVYEVFQFARTVLSDDKGVIYMAKPAAGLQWGRFKQSLLQVLM
jgi:hypothetical protein